MKSVCWIKVALALLGVSCLELLPCCIARPDATGVPINLTHLNRLRREVRLPGGQTLAVWWVYCDSAEATRAAEPYRFVEATGEGASCVDDVARAALVYLKHWELFQDAASLQHARECFRFLKTLQAPDGTYFNWLRADGTPNTTRVNSLPGLTWWSARAFWALAEGSRALQGAHPDDSRALAARARPIIALLQRHVDTTYRTYRVVNGYRMPLWLVGGGSDLTATFLLGLCAYEEVNPSQEMRSLLRKLAEAVTAMQGGDAEAYPWCGYRAWSGDPLLLHGWGSHQMAALANAGRLLHDGELTASAERCASLYVTHLLAGDGPIYASAPVPTVNEQIAYAVEAEVDGLLALEQATHKPIYSDLAVLAASWLRGNNALQANMYDAHSGRGYDGITDAGGVNWNSGAESTIEALYTLLLLTEHHVPLQRIEMKRTGGRTVAVLNRRTGIVSGTLSSGQYRIFAAVKRPRGEVQNPIQVSVAVDGSAAGATSLSEQKTADLLALPKVLLLSPPPMPDAAAVTWNGAAETDGAKVTALLYQPVIEYSTTATPSGLTMMLLRSWSGAPEPLRDIIKIVHSHMNVTTVDQQGRQKDVTGSRGEPGTLPPYGWAIVTFLSR